MSAYLATAPMPGHTMPAENLRRSGSIDVEKDLCLQGPLEVAGSVNSGRSIEFEGDFNVAGSIDAYGKITTRGNMRCE